MISNISCTVGRTMIHSSSRDASSSQYPSKLGINSNWWSKWLSGSSCVAHGAAQHAQMFKLQVLHQTSAFWLCFAQLFIKFLSQLHLSFFTLNFQSSTTSVIALFAGRSLKSETDIGNLQRGQQNDVLDSWFSEISALLVLWLVWATMPFMQPEQTVCEHGKSLGSEKASRQTGQVKNVGVLNFS